jgi:excisionase family DNA binding protein
MKQKLLTPAEAAELKGVSRAAVYAAIAQDRLPHTRVLGRLAVREADVLSWTPVQYAGRPGRKGGRPTGVPVSEEARARMSEAQKRRWARRKP